MRSRVNPYACSYVCIRYRADATMTSVRTASAPSSTRNQSRSVPVARDALRAATPSTTRVSMVTTSNCQNPVRAYSA
jgi:hypothetical protein